MKTRMRMMRRLRSAQTGFPVRRGLLVGMAIALLVLTVCVLVFWVAERGGNENVAHPGSALRWVTVTLLIGEPAFDTTTGVGLFVFYMVVVAGVGLVAMGTGVIASKLVEIMMRRDQGMKDAKEAAHIVICGWSSKGPEILRELHAEEVDDKRPVVILADLPTNPTTDDLVTFVRGDPTHGEDLVRAGIDRADTAIILADQTNAALGSDDVDARTLLTTLAVESINRGCYSCVEVIRSENRQHFERTGADELIVSAELTGALLASAAVNHGLSAAVTDLLTHPEGAEFYAVGTPPDLVGMTFRQALSHLKDNHDCILVAVARPGARFEINAPASREIRADDRLLVVADSDVAAGLARAAHGGAGDRAAAASERAPAG